jgi:hypothetical protein
VFAPAPAEEDERPPRKKVPPANVPKTPPRRQDNDSDEESPPPRRTKKAVAANDEAADNDEAAANDDVDDRPRKRKGKRAKGGSNLVLLLAVGGVAGVLLLGGVAAGLWALGVFGTTAKPQAKVDTKGMPPETKGKPPGDGWQPYHSATGRFTVEIPDSLVADDEQPDPKRNGGKRQSFGPKLRVLYSDLQPQELSDGPKAFLKNLGFVGTVKEKHDIDLDGNPGVAAITQVAKTELYQRFFVVGSRLYEFQALVNDDAERKDAERFMKSIKFQK